MKPFLILIISQCYQFWRKDLVWHFQILHLYMLCTLTVLTYPLLLSKHFVKRRLFSLQMGKKEIFLDWTVFEFG